MAGTEDNTNKSVIAELRELRDELLQHPSLNKSFKAKVTSALTGVEEKISDNVTNTLHDKRYRLIFENTPLGIIHFDKNGVITECNRQFIEIIGSSKEKLIGLDMTRLPDKDMARAVHQALSGKKSTFSGLYKAVTSGKKIRGRTIFEPIVDAAGICIGGIGLVEDESDLYQALLALRESENRYRNLFERSYSVMFIIDPETGIIYDANEAAATFYGWTQQELLQMNIQEINTLPNKDVMKHMEQVRNNDQHVFLCKHRKSDGSVCDVEEHSGKIPIKNQEMLYTIVHDVSKRTKALNELLKFRLGIERSSNAVFITDYDGNIEYVNPAFEKMYGYTKQEVIEKNPRVLQSGQHSKSYYEKFWSTIKSGKVMSGVIINETKDGTLLNVNFTSNPIVKNDGTITGFIAIQNDITNQKQLEEKLRNSLYEKDIMLAEIHHRVKNNLAMISAMMMFQAENATNNELKEKLTDSINRIKAIANIHEHLYETTDFANVDFEKNTEALISNIIQTLQHPTSVTIKNESSPVTLNVNQGIYCSIIINEVVSNIIKHAFNNLETGSITLKISETNRTIHISIIDDGHPLPEDFPNKIDSSLGIELIHLLTRQLDGKLQFKQLKNGSEFNLSFKKADIDNNPLQVKNKVTFEKG